MDPGIAVPPLPPRPREAHKGAFGHVLVVATSPGMTGAGVLAARAALRVGAGLATLAVPRSLEPIVAARLLSEMTLGLPEGADAVLDLGARPRILEAASRADVVVLGPGMGRATGTRELVRALWAELRGPLVADADALFALVGGLGPREGPTVLTPHPGELATLMGLSSAEIQAARTERARELAAAHGVVVVLKGAGTVISDGQQEWINPTGNPGMATAGTGDVLAGVCGGLLAQGMDALPAARLAAYLHGLAGDLAAARLGQHALVAPDLLDHLPAALLHHGSPSGPR